MVHYDVVFVQNVVESRLLARLVTAYFCHAHNQPSAA